MSIYTFAFFALLLGVSCGGDGQTKPIGSSMPGWVNSTAIITTTNPTGSTCHCPKATSCEGPPPYKITGNYLVIPGWGSSITYSLLPSQARTEIVSASSEAPVPATTSSVVVNPVIPSPGVPSDVAPPAQQTTGVKSAIMTVIVTKTVKATSSYLVSTCAPGAKGCTIGVMTSTVVPTTSIALSSSLSVSTVVSDVNSEGSPVPIATPTPETSVVIVWVTETKYSTSTFAVTSCSPGVTNCPRNALTTTISTMTVSSPSASTTIVSPVVSTTVPSSDTPAPLPMASTSVVVVWITETKFSTSTFKVTSCSPGAKCTAGEALKTSVVPITTSSASTSTTIISLASETPKTSPAVTSVPSKKHDTTKIAYTTNTTSTLYATRTHTLRNCKPGLKECPETLTKIVTSVIPVGTTVCPVVISGNSTSVVTTAIPKWANSTSSSTLLSSPTLISKSNLPDHSSFKHHKPSHRTKTHLYTNSTSMSSAKYHPTPLWRSHSKPLYTHSEASSSPSPSSSLYSTSSSYVHSAYTNTTTSSSTLVKPTTPAYTNSTSPVSPTILSSSSTSVSSISKSSSSTYTKPSSSSHSTSPPMTTSTVFSTRQHTIIDETSTRVITSVIAVSTTICPVNTTSTRSHVISDSSLPYSHVTSSMPIFTTSIHPGSAGNWTHPSSRRLPSIYESEQSKPTSSPSSSPEVKYTPTSTRESTNTMPTLWPSSGQEVKPTLRPNNESDRPVSTSGSQSAQEAKSTTAW